MIAFGLLPSFAWASSKAKAAAPVPAGFVGMNIDGPALSPQVDLGQEMSQMVATGVQRVRIVVNWLQEQPYSSYSQLPQSSVVPWTNVGGVPTDFTSTDQIVESAAAHGLQVLPVVLYAPDWAAEHPGQNGSPPSNDAAYANFVAALVQRYGRNGSFWAANPSLRKVPVTAWQIWNEPNLLGYWSDRPWVPGYVNLLRAANKAIKGVDRSAQVVLAGTPNFSWEYLAGIYRIRGARKLFDVVAVHPYTKTPRHVLGFLELVRHVMNENGDRAKPMIATEMGFPSSVGKATTIGFETTERGQAVYSAQTIKLLAGHRPGLGLAGFDYYSWMGEEYSGAYTFNYSGLFAFTGGTVRVKPAYAAFRSVALAIEHCKVPGPLAGQCAKRG